MNDFAQMQKIVKLHCFVLNYLSAYPIVTPYLWFFFDTLALAM